jgi:hypothetical protein
MIHTAVLFLMVVAVSLHHASPANANPSFTIGGTVGPSGPSTTTCAANAVLIGFKAHTGVYVDGLRPVCIAVTSSGHWTGSATTGQFIGTMGSSSEQHTAICPQDTAVEQVSAHSGWWLDELSVSCQTLTTPTTTTNSGGTKVYVGGQDNGAAVGSGNCAGHPIIQVRGTWGNYVNRLTFTCAA